MLGGNHPVVSRLLCGNQIAFWHYSHDIKAGTSDVGVRAIIAACHVRQWISATILDFEGVVVAQIVDSSSTLIEGMRLRVSRPHGQNLVCRVLDLNSFKSSRYHAALSRERCESRDYS